MNGTQSQTKGYFLALREGNGESMAKGVWEVSPQKSSLEILI